jgi:hypothetical protein
MFTSGEGGGYVAEKAETASGWLFPSATRSSELGYVDMFTTCSTRSTRAARRGDVLRRLRRQRGDGRVLPRRRRRGVGAGRARRLARRRRPAIARSAPRARRQTVIKEEQMPDGRRKLILKDEATGEFVDVVA